MHKPFEVKIWKTQHNSKPKQFFCIIIVYIKILVFTKNLQSKWPLSHELWNPLLCYVKCPLTYGYVGMLI